MGVDLGVEGAARVLSEECGDDSLRVNDGDLAADAVAGVGVPFDPVHHRLDRPVVRVEDSLADIVVTECEEYGHGLRCRAGDVESAHRGVAVFTAEVSVGSGRVAPVHDREEVLVVELPGEAEFEGGVPDPVASGLVGVEVVARELLDVVAPGAEPLQASTPGRSSPIPESVPERDCALVCI